MSRWGICLRAHHREGCWLVTSLIAPTLMTLLRSTTGILSCSAPVLCSSSWLRCSCLWLLARLSFAMATVTFLCCMVGQVCVGSCKLKLQANKIHFLGLVKCYRSFCILKGFFWLKGRGNILKILRTSLLCSSPLAALLCDKMFRHQIDETSTTKYKNKKHIIGNAAICTHG